MDIPSFARRKRKAGELDPQAAAEEYLKAALESEDPHGALLPAVRAMMGDQFRSLRRALRKESAAWDAPQIPGPVRRYDPSAVAASQATINDRRALLIKTQVWTATRGNILWEDLTLDDIPPTLEAYGREIQGIESLTERFRSAERVMRKHDVSRLGDVPWDEITGIVE